VGRFAAHDPVGPIVPAELRLVTSSDILDVQKDLVAPLAVPDLPTGVPGIEQDRADRMLPPRSTVTVAVTFRVVSTGGGDGVLDADRFTLVPDGAGASLRSLVSALGLLLRPGSGRGRDRARSARPSPAEWRGRFRDNAGIGTGQILRVSIEPTKHCPADSSDRPWVSRRAVNHLAWAVGPLASLSEAWIFWPVEASWNGDPLESLTWSKQRSAIRE
jgi:hypothetical protein